MGTELTANGDTKEYRGDMTIADLKKEANIPERDTVFIDGLPTSDKDRLEHFDDGAAISHIPTGGMDSG